MPDTTIGSLIISVLADDAHLKAVLAQYQARSINITVGTTGTQAAAAALHGVGAGANVAAQGVQNLFTQQAQGAIGSRQYAQQTGLLTAALSGVTGQYAAVTGAANTATTATNNATVAQQRSTAAARTAIGSVAGIGGAGGLNNAAMALSFINPQAGMIAMAASMGPVIAGAAVIGLGLTAIVKLTRDGVGEAKLLQQAYLTLAANGGNDIGQVNAALNEMIAHGTAAEMMFSKSELAGSLAELARGGVKGADGLLVLRTAANLAAVEHVKLNDATKELYNNMQHLGLAFTDVAAFGDKLARATHLTTSSMDSFSAGMNVVGATTHTLGFSIDETLGMLVKLAQKGMDPATIGATGLRNMLLHLEAAPKNMKGHFAELGVALNDVNGHARSGRDVFMDLQRVFTTTEPIYNALTHTLITQTDKARLASEMFGTRSATAFLGTLGPIRQVTEEIQRSQGFLQTYSDVVTNGLEGAQKRLDAATKNLSSTFAQLFIPAMTSVVKVLQGGVTDLNSFVTGLTSASQGVEKFALMDVKASDSPVLKFLETINNVVMQIDHGVASVTDAMNTLSNFTGLHKVGDALVGVLPSLGDDAQRNRIAQQKSMAEIAAAKAQLPVLQHQLELAKLNPANSTVRPQGSAIGFANSGMFGPLPAATSRVQDLENAIAALTKTIGGGEANLAKLRTASGIGGGFEAGPGVLPLKTGDKFADNFVEYCSRWVRISLEKSNPQLTGALNKLFGATADISKSNFKTAGLLHPFTGIKDLQPGDTVFYDNNHVGVYIGNGMVRGNNRMSNAATGGRDPVGDNYISSLGSIAGFARLSEVAQKMGLNPAAPSGVPKLASSVTPPNMDPNASAASGPSLEELRGRFLGLQTAYKSGKMDLDAYRNALEGVRAQAETLAGTQKVNSKEWTATERFIIATSAALKTHTGQVEQAALTWAQWLKNRSAASALAQRESDMNDGKMGAQDVLQTKADLQSYRGDPVQAQALIEAERQLVDRTKRIEEGKKTAAQQAKDAEQQAKDDAAQAKQAAADAVKLLRDGEQTIRVLRSQNLEMAVNHRDAVKVNMEGELADAGENVTRKLAVQTRYAANLKALNIGIANMQFNIDRRAALSGPPAEQAGAITLATQKRDASLKEASGTQAVTEATAKQTEAVKAQRTAYSGIADTLRQSIKDGNLDAEARLKVVKSLNEQHDAAQKLGILDNQYIVPARDTVRALLERGDAAYLAAQNMKDLNRVMDASNDQNTRMAQDAVARADALTSVGDEAGALDALHAALADVMTEAGKGGIVGDSVSVLMNALKKFDETDLQILVRTARTLQTVQQTLLDLNVAGAALGIAPGDARPETNRPMENAPQNTASDMLHAIGLGPDAFLELARTTLPDALMEGTTADSYAGLGVVVLRGLVDGLTNVPGWDKVKEAMQAGLNQATEVASLVMNAPNVPGVRTGNERADDRTFGPQAEETQSDFQKNLAQLGRSDVISGLKNLDDATVQATADFAAGAQDVELYNAAIGELKTRADAAKVALENLPIVKIQAALSDLNRLHVAGGIPTAAFITTEQGLKTDLENAQYKVSSAKLTGAALEAAEIEHQGRLKQIIADGVQGQLQVYTDAAAKRIKVQEEAAAYLVGSRGAELSLARTHLDNQHAFQLVSDRAFQTEREGQDRDAAKASYDAGKISLFEYEEDLTRITKQGVLDRAALDKAGLDSFVQGIQSLGGALEKMGGSLGIFGKSFNAGVQVFNQVQKSIVQTQKAFGAGGSFVDKLGAVGGWAAVAAAAIDAIGSIGDAMLAMNPVFQKQKQNWLELASAEQAAMGSKNYGGKSIINPYYDALKKDSEALTTKANAGFWQRLGWAIFGGAPKTLDKAAAESLTAAGQIFNDFAQSLYGSMESALMNAFDSGNFDGVAKAIEKSLNELVAKMYLQTLIAKSRIGADLKMLADDQSAGKSITADVARLKDDAASVTAQFKAGAGSLPGFGAGAADATTGGNATLIGAPPAAQFGIPEIKFPDSMLSALTNIGSMDIPLFNKGSQMMYDGGALMQQAAQIIIGNNSGRQTQRSGLSGLI